MLRQFYIPIAVLLGVAALLKVYNESFRLMLTYEDYLDWLVFQQVKRGYPVEKLARVMYKTD